MPFIYECTKELQLISADGEIIESIEWKWDSERQESKLGNVLSLSKWFEQYGPMNWHRDIPGDPEKFKRVTELPNIEPGTQEPAKPAVVWHSSPNQSSRNGVPIRRIVLHYTTVSTIPGTISWFKNPASRVSAHYLVGRNGELVQFVSDDRKAWHAAGANSDSLGIENAAAPGQRLTEAQEEKLVELLKYLVAEYKIPLTNITAHRFIGNNTSCPGDLWKSKGELAAWINAKLA